jgi:hypothetical protein
LLADADSADGLRHDDPYRSKSITKATALAFHELSCAGTLHASGYHLKFGVRGIG